MPGKSPFEPGSARHKAFLTEVGIYLNAIDMAREQVPTQAAPVQPTPPLAKQITHHPLKWLKPHGPVNILPSTECTPHIIGHLTVIQADLGETHICQALVDPNSRRVQLFLTQ